VARKRFITGVPSQYALYLEHLERSGTQTAGVWRTFLLLSLLTDGGVGAVSFATTRALSSSEVNGTTIVLYIAFVLAAASETYFFLMQRLPLELSREHNLDPAQARLMLPDWYALVWLSKISKWVSLAFIWYFEGWLPALICFVVAFLVSMAIPVPYKHFADILERRLIRLLASDMITAGSLLTALRASRVKHGF
jgi:hypothetical protein